MGHVRGNQPVEFGDELMDSLGGKVEAERLDGDQPVAVRIVRAENRPQGAGANLMENPEWTEGVWRRSSRSVGLQ
jgi:hypothetical protein